MNQFSLFSSGIDLANLVVSSDLLQQSWNDILGLYRDSNQSDANLPPSVKYRVYTHQLYGTVVAFVSSPNCTVQHLEGEGRDLISSETLRREKFSCFDFLSTKSNQAFSIHKAAIFLFRSLYDDLFRLRNHLLDITTPLIITGHSIGGSIASLFTLWLLESISPRATRRPLCITFGSPLVGDYGFQQAILERPIWTSCFLHVASNCDPIPKLFISPHDHLAIVSTSQNGIYQPFGTFLLCSEHGCACFEEPKLVSELLVAMKSDSVGLNQDPCNYSWILEYRAIYKGSAGLTEQVSTLRGGIITQLEAIGVTNSQLQQCGNIDINTLITAIEERTTKNLVIQKRNGFATNKNLTDRKIEMSVFYSYMKVTRSNRGYYDSYKTVLDQSQATLVKYHRKLTIYWKTMVAEADKMPQKEGASFRTRWLYAGISYRRMVEPFDIADYYRKGKRDYKTRGRSEHYVFLEKWLNDAPRNNANKRTAACDLTEDSCFWAHVEEAIISCKLLTATETSQAEKESSREKLTKFDSYAMDLINDFGVSTEIFLEQSSFMQWWREYETVIGTSPLIEYVRSGKHKKYA